MSTYLLCLTSITTLLILFLETQVERVGCQDCGLDATLLPTTSVVNLSSYLTWFPAMQWQKWRNTNLLQVCHSIDHCSSRLLYLIEVSGKQFAEGFTRQEEERKHLLQMRGKKCNLKPGPPKDHKIIGSWKSFVLWVHMRAQWSDRKVLSSKDTVWDVTF